MAIKFNTNRAKNIGWLLLTAAVVYGVIKMIIFMYEAEVSEKNQQQQEFEQQAKNRQDWDNFYNKVNSMIGEINTRKIGSVEYSIIGPNTIRIVEGDVSYRFNYAAEIVSVRNTLKNVTQTDQIAALSFQEVKQDYTEKLKATGCQIVLEAKNPEKWDMSEYPQESKDGINSAYADVIAFGQVYCNQSLKKEMSPWHG
jgi:hypothetical protein